MSDLLRGRARASRQRRYLLVGLAFVTAFFLFVRFSWTQSFAWESFLPTNTPLATPTTGYATATTATPTTGYAAATAAAPTRGITTQASRATLTPTATRTVTPTSSPTTTLTPTSSPTVVVADAKTERKLKKTRTPRPTRTRRPTRTPTATATVTPTPTLTPVPVPRTARVPILMYHRVAELPPNADALRRDLTVLPERFNAQLKFLAEQGYTPVRLVDLARYIRGEGELPAKPIVLTFDDGYDDNYLHAFPTLKDFGFPGTFFIITAPAQYSSDGYLTWEQIEEMAENGMEIGSHSLTHRYNLGGVAASVQRQEIADADAMLREHFPDWVPIFSFPSGSYNSTTLGILEELDYVAAVTTRQGTLQSGRTPFELRRVRVRGGWTDAQFVNWFNYWIAQP